MGTDVRERANRAAVIAEQDDVDAADSEADRLAPFDGPRRQSRIPVFAKAERRDQAPAVVRIPGLNERRRLAPRTAHRVTAPTTGPSTAKLLKPLYQSHREVLAAKCAAVLAWRTDQDGVAFYSDSVSRHRHFARFRSRLTGLQIEPAVMQRAHHFAVLLEQFALVQPSALMTANVADCVIVPVNTGDQDFFLAHFDAHHGALRHLALLGRFDKLGQHRVFNLLSPEPDNP